MELNKIYNEDCLEGMKRIHDKSVDMILCDLPYGTTACSWDTIIPLDPLWEQYKRVIKDNGAIVLTASQPFTTTLINSNFNGMKHIWYWNKENGGNFAVAKYMPQKVIEEIVVFSKDGERVNYYPIMEDVEKGKVRPINRPVKRKESNPQGMASGIIKTSYNYSNKKRDPKDVLTFNHRAKELNSSQRVHPTQKPVALFEYLIKKHTTEEYMILDHCMGIGKTAIAYINTNRNYIGIEKEKEYVDIANERINNHKDMLPNR